MLGICLLALAAQGAAISPLPSKPVMLATEAFTLSWRHSIEKILWEEDYQIIQQGQDGEPTLTLTSARIRGTGAGMEPPEGAVFKHGVWHYHPELQHPLTHLSLRRSGFVTDYQLCLAPTHATHPPRCHALGDWLPKHQRAAEIVNIKPCKIN